MRRWTAASLLVVTALFARVARQPGVAVFVAIALIAAAITPYRAKLGKTGARVATAAAAIAGLVVGSIASGPHRVEVLPKPWPALALAGLFAGAARLFLAPPPGEGDREGAPFALLPGLVAIMACGETAGGWIYAAAVIAWLALGLAALRAGDAGRPPIADLPAKKRLAAISLLGLGAALAAGSMAGLPPASRWMERRILRAIGAAETGFSDQMWLGALDGLLDSDEVVMRLEGPRTDYLRGAVFDHYEIGRWGHVKTPRASRVDVPPSDASPGRVRVTVVGGTRDRYFLPKGASAVSAKGAGLASDRYGLLRATEGGASEASFAIDVPPAFAIEGPTDDDLDIPPALKRPLTRIAAQWTAGATSPEEKLAAIVKRLAGFTYARSFTRRRSDPILDFLIDDKRGHCEYFATATALLSRAAGVPARVVAGYRVAEENAVGGYWVVRERNAHAWAEVWLPDRGFVTVDTTPADPLAQNAPHTTRWLSAVLDVASVWWSRALGRVTVLDLVYAGLAVIAIGLVIRRVRQMPRGRRERLAVAHRAPPPPSLLRLLDALGKRGARRAESEPIERFAARIEGDAAEAAALLVRWAALRYGGLGDADALARETDACVEKLRGA